jgi:hypothetical protein
LLGSSGKEGAVSGIWEKVLGQLQIGKRYSSDITNPLWNLSKSDGIFKNEMECSGRILLK